MLRDDDRDGFFFVLVSVQQCNLGDLRALRKGMTLYHSESQLSSLPKRQEAMLNVSTRRRTTDRPTVHTHTCVQCSGVADIQTFGLVTLACTHVTVP